MARIQILELPTVEREDGRDETPFVLVIDEAPAGHDGFPDLERLKGSAEQIGARHILIFADTVEIPANDVPVDPDGYPLKIRVEPDFEAFRAQVEEQAAYAKGRVTRAFGGSDDLQ